MEIKLDIDAVAGIASAAIFDAMSQDVRDSVIKQAIEFLITPEQERFGTGKTPLQNAFDSAIRDASYKIVRDQIANNPEVEKGILELLGPLLTSAMNAEADQFNSSLSDTLGHALGNWLSEIARKNGER